MPFTGDVGPVSFMIPDERYVEMDEIPDISLQYLEMICAENLRIRHEVDDACNNSYTTSIVHRRPTVLKNGEELTMTHDAVDDDHIATLYICPRENKYTLITGLESVVHKAPVDGWSVVDIVHVYRVSLDRAIQTIAPDAEFVHTHDGIEYTGVVWSPYAQPPGNFPIDATETWEYGSQHLVVHKRICPDRTEFFGKFAFIKSKYGEHILVSSVYSVIDSPVMLAFATILGEATGLAVFVES